MSGEQDPLLGDSGRPRQGTNSPSTDKGAVKRWPLKGSLDSNVVTICSIAYAAAGIGVAFVRPWVLAVGGKGLATTSYRFYIASFTTSNRNGTASVRYDDVDCGNCRAASIAGLAGLAAAAFLLAVCALVYALKALRFVRAKSVGHLLSCGFVACSALAVAVSVLWISICRPHLEALVTVKYRGDTLGEPIALLPAAGGFCLLAAAANSAAIVRWLARIFEKKGMDHLGINFAVFGRLLRLFTRAHLLLAFVAAWPAIQSNIEDASSPVLDPVGDQGANVALTYFAYVGLILIAFGAFHWERFWRQKLERRNQLMRVAIDRQASATPPRSAHRSLPAGFVAAALEASEVSAADYTVLVRNVPADCINPRELASFFEGNVGPVAMATLVPCGIRPFLALRREWDDQLLGAALYGARAGIGLEESDTDLTDVESGAVGESVTESGDDYARALRPSFSERDSDEEDDDDDGRERGRSERSLRAESAATSTPGSLSRKVPRRSSLTQSTELEQCVPLPSYITRAHLLRMAANTRDRIDTLRRTLNAPNSVFADSAREGEKAEDIECAGAAFVTFRRSVDAAKCHALFVQDSRQMLARHVSGSKREYPRFRGALLQVERAPHPEDVNWGSLSDGLTFGQRTLWLAAFWLCAIGVGMAVVWLLYLLKASKRYVAPDDGPSAHAGMWSGAGFAFFLAAPIAVVHRVACAVIAMLAAWTPSASKADRDRLRIEATVLVLGGAQAFLVASLLGQPPSDASGESDFWWPQYFAIPFEDFQVLALAAVTTKLVLHVALGVLQPVFWVRRWLLSASAVDLAKLRALQLRPAIDLPGEVIALLDIMLWCILYIKICASTLLFAPIALAVFSLVMPWAYARSYRRPPRSEFAYSLLGVSVRTLTGTGLFMCLLVSAVSGLLDVLLIDRDCERRTQEKHFSDSASRGYLALFLSLAVALGGRALQIFYVRCIRPFWRMPSSVPSPWEERPPFSRLVGRSGGRLHVPPLVPELDVACAQLLRSLTTSFEFDVPWSQRRLVERHAP